VNNGKIFILRGMGRGRFVNPHVGALRKSTLDFLLWRLGYYDEPALTLSPPADFIYPGLAKPFKSQEPSAVWIGHSTYLIEVGGLTILTDPVWDEYCSPVPIPALRRLNQPPIQLADLPPIDIVLISHNHYDHLDAKTVTWLNKFHPQIQWIVPSRLAPWFFRKNIYNVKELAWWKSFTMQNAKVTAVPAQHFSGRSLLDTNKTHWCGYVLETGGKRIYFVGDTGYNNKDFKEIGRRFSHMDLSLIPIGTYSPQKFMQPVHINPQEAVQIHEDVKSTLSLGMHWNTFCLSDEPKDRPPFDLYLAMKTKKFSFDTFLPIEIGSYINF
jgi:N-acyl-phosphatidylethanolamine-hydrolysing phospholipase D